MVYFSSFFYIFFIIIGATRKWIIVKLLSILLFYLNFICQSLRLVKRNIGIACLIPSLCLLLFPASESSSSESRLFSPSTGSASTPTSPPKPSLSTVKLLNTITFETIDCGSDTSDVPEDGSLRGGLFSTTASETVDSGIGNDEVASESSVSSRVLGFRSSDLKNGIFENVNDEESAKILPKVSTPDYQPKVTLVTSRFSCLSDLYEGKKVSEKSPPEVVSPSTSIFQSHFNIRLLKENALRESDTLEPPQSSPSHEDSASTCSFLTVSGSSGYFSKAGTTEGSASPKFSPSADSFMPGEETEECSVSKHVGSSSVLQSERLHTNTQTTESFKPTRFSFLTNEYLPNTPTIVSKEVSPSLPSSPVEVCDPTVASTAPSTSSDESSATVITSTAVYTAQPPKPVPLAAASDTAHLPKSRFFPFLNLNRAEHSPAEPMSPASDESHRSPSGDTVCCIVVTQ